MNRKVYKLINSLTHKPKSLNISKTYIIIEGERMNKIITVTPLRDRDDIYGFKIEVTITEEIPLGDDVKAYLREESTLNIVLSEAEKVGEWLKELITDVEKKMETTKSNLNHIIETIKKIAEETKYEVRFIREIDP